MLGCWHAIPGKRPSFERLNDNFLIAAKVLGAEIRTASKVAASGGPLAPSTSARSATDGYEREAAPEGEEAGRSSLPGASTLPAASGAAAGAVAVLDVDGYVADVQHQAAGHALALDSDGYVAESDVDAQPQALLSFDEDGYVAEPDVDAQPQALLPLDEDGYVAETRVDEAAGTRAGLQTAAIDGTGYLDVTSDGATVSPQADARVATGTPAAGHHGYAPTRLGTGGPGATARAAGAGPTPATPAPLESGSKRDRRAKKLRSSTVSTSTGGAVQVAPPPAACLLCCDWGGVII